MKHIERLIIAVGLPVLAVMISSAASAKGEIGEISPSAPPPPPIEVRWERIAVGDIVLSGVLNEGGVCEIGSFNVVTTAQSDGGTRWLGILLNEQCQVVVNAKWEGALEEGPQNVVRPLLRLLSTETEPVPEETTPIGASGNEMYAVAASGTKTSEQHVYMYGLGGQWDKLTHKYGKITFSYDGTNAWITSESGSCNGSSFAYWRWVVDACLRIGYGPGPSSIVWRTGRGDYHCDPTGVFPCNASNPDGFYHSLFDDEDGHANGVSHCNYWWSGIIVSGVNREILQGCS